MSRLTQTLMAGAAAALVTGAGLAAYAQPAPAPQPRAERQEHMAMRREDRAKDQAQHLRNILQLRPNQEAALTAYLASQKMDHEGMMRMAAGGPPKTTPERLALMEQQMAAHQAQMKARFDATRAFYAQLDASQKKAFDELPMMMGGHDGMRMHAMKAMRHGGSMPPMHGKPMAPTPPAPPAH